MHFLQRCTDIFFSEVDGDGTGLLPAAAVGPAAAAAPQEGSSGAPAGGHGALQLPVLPRRVGPATKPGQCMQCQELTLP